MKGVGGWTFGLIRVFLCIMFANEELVTKLLNIISVDYANVVSEISCWTIQVRERVSCGGGGIEEEMSPNWVVTSSITNNRHELILLSFPSLNYISILLVIWMFSKAREEAWVDHHCLLRSGSELRRHDKHDALWIGHYNSQGRHLSVTEDEEEETTAKETLLNKYSQIHNS